MLVLCRLIEPLLAVGIHSTFLSKPDSESVLGNKRPLKEFLIQPSTYMPKDHLIKPFDHAHGLPRQWGHGFLETDIPKIGLPKKYSVD